MSSSAAAPGTRPWIVARLPAFEDNYLWVIHDTRTAVAVDPGDATVISRHLAAHGLALEAILCTHHHADHVGGVTALQSEFPGARVFGPADERIPALGRAVAEGDTLTLAPGTFRVMEVPGHTRSHIAYLWQDHLFCGDTLFALGCGRLFEGSAAQMHHSLARLAALPGDWWVHCAHEYTLANLAFALQVDGDNAALQARGAREQARRARGEATVPSSLEEERHTNPFLRADAPALRASAERWQGATLADPVAVFAALREWKNGFRA